MRPRLILRIFNSGVSCAALSLIVLAQIYQADRTSSLTIMPILVVCSLSAAALSVRPNIVLAQLAIAANLLMLIFVATVITIAVTGLAGLFGIVPVLLLAGILFALNWVCLRRLISEARSLK